MGKSKYYIITFILIASIASFILYLYQSSNNKLKNANLSYPNNSASYPTSNVIEQTVLTTGSATITTSDDIDLQNLPKNLPSFITFQKNTITVNPNKYSVGNYKFTLNPESTSPLSYSITVKIPDADFDKVTNDLKNYFGKDMSNYGVYVYDLLRNKTIALDADTTFEPASIAKMPVAVLVMRDIEAGKYTLQKTYPIKDSEKFSMIGSLGSLPSGTPISIDTYLHKMLIDSDNNAWYALVHYLGNSYQVVNPRIINELGVNPLFLDPPMGTPRNVGKIFTDIYFHKTVNQNSADYIFNLLENALPSNRAGVGLGLPAGTVFANKIGTLSASGKESYQDGAVVWGKLTDYVIVVMDKSLAWEAGPNKLKEISSIIYNGID